MSLLDHSLGLPQRTFDAGETVITEGDEVGRLFVLAKGTVVVERDDIAVARIDTPGAMFGEMSLLLQTPATATVRCETATVMRVADTPRTFLTEEPEAALEVARVLAPGGHWFLDFLDSISHNGRSPDSREYIRHPSHGDLDLHPGLQESPYGVPGEDLALAGDELLQALDLRETEGRLQRVRAAAGVVRVEQVRQLPGDLPVHGEVARRRGHA